MHRTCTEIEGDWLLEIAPHYYDLDNFPKSGAFVHCCYCAIARIRSSPAMLLLLPSLMMMMMHTYVKFYVRLFTNSQMVVAHCHLYMTRVCTPKPTPTYVYTEAKMSLERIKMRQKLKSKYK